MRRRSERLRIRDMRAEEGRGGTLLPGLPEELVLFHVVSRLPWYARPVCRSISKRWRASLDTLKTQAGLAVETRKHQLPLLKGLFLISTSADSQLFLTRHHAHNCTQRATYFNVREGRICPQWRRLPPLQGLLRPRDVYLLANYGMLYVWSIWESSVVLKMDLGCGEWTWSKHSVPHTLGENVIFSGKIYTPWDDVDGSQTELQKKESVLIYDMMRDQCKEVVTWNFRYTRVLLKTSFASGSHVEDEELYGLVEHRSTLELVVYDACKDSWRSIREIPYPTWKWEKLSEIHILNGDCFEPAAEMDINIIWWDEEAYYMSWFNPSLHKTWVHMECNYDDLFIDEVLFIRGSLYGVLVNFRDHDDEEDESNYSEEEEEEDKKKESEEQKAIAPLYYNRSIMKGKIYVAESIVKWETVHDVGYFEENAILPVQNCTMIA